MNRQEAHILLGTTVTSTPAQIKDAYKRATLKFHPDKHGNTVAANNTFRKIKEAFEWLEKYGAKETVNVEYTTSVNMDEWLRQSGYTRANRPKVDLNDLNEDVIGQNWGRRQADTGIARVVMNLTLEEAFNGCTKSYTLANKSYTVAVPAGTVDRQALLDNMSVQVRALVDLPPGCTVDWVTGNITQSIKIPVIRLMAGGYVEYRTVDGAAVSIRVPAGLESNSLLKVKGRGFWRADKNKKTLTPMYRGDALLRVVPDIKKFSDLSYEELAELQTALDDRRTPSSD